MAKTVPDPILSSYIHLLHRASQRADDAFADAMGGDELTARQLVVLKIVRDLDRPSQVDIVDRSGIDRSTLADIVRRMAQKGLIVRRRTREDARRYALKLTELGENVLALAMERVRKADAEIVSGLTTQQRQQLTNVLQLLLNARDSAQPS